MRKMLLGIFISLVLVTTSPVVAVEESPVQWPSFDLAEWVFGWLEIFELKSFSAEMGLGAGPNGEPAEEFGSAAEPGGDEDEPPTSEIGPAIDPGGETTEEMGPGLDPLG